MSSRFRLHYPIIALFSILSLALFPQDAETRSDRSEQQYGANTYSPEWEREIQRVLKNFQRRFRGRRASSRLTRLLSEIEQQFPEFSAGAGLEDADLRSQRALTAGLITPAGGGSRSEFKRRSVGSSKSRNTLRPYPLPREVEYRFGSRTLEPTGKRNRSLRAAIDRRSRLTLEHLSAGYCVEQLLHGRLPDSELGLAAIQMELDVLKTADRFGLFLEAWRNHGADGDESMYEALDRTAGTSESPFFYDALLSEFVKHFAGKQGRRWSLEDRYHRLHRAFLSYRQYRGLVEAVAFALVLPPDIPFPERLSRYDYLAVSAGLLSLRHQIDLLVHFESGDQVKVVERVQHFLLRHPLPAELWLPYNPLRPFSDEFLKLARVHTSKRGLSTDQIWRLRQQKALETARRIRGVCRLALAD